MALLNQTLQLCDRYVDLPGMRVLCTGLSHKLTSKEADLLAYLARHEGHIVSRSELLTEVWGYVADSSSRTVDTTVRRLRKKIERDGRNPRHLFTVHGEGYRLCLKDSVATIQNLPLPSPNELTTKKVQLPEYKRKFIGRQRERLAVMELLDSGHSTVVLLGTAGVGKSRLAVEIGQAYAGRGQRVEFCDAARATSISELNDILLHMLAVASVGVSRPQVVVQQKLKELGKCLLIVDNVEQLAEELRGGALPWQGCDVQVLLTTRDRLGLAREVAYLLPPLSLDDGVSLFQQRAFEASETYRVQSHELEAVTRVVRALEGLPLCIELAAGRLSILSVRDILHSLDGLLELLVSSDSEGARHSSLQAALEWSWTRLAPAQQRLMYLLSCFEHPFLLSQVHEILGDTGSYLALANEFESLENRTLLTRRYYPELGEMRFSVGLPISAFIKNKADEVAEAMALLRDYDLAVLRRCEVENACAHGAKEGELYSRLRFELPAYLAAFQRLSSGADGKAFPILSVLRRWLFRLPLGPLRFLAMCQRLQPRDSEEQFLRHWLRLPALRFLGKLSEAELALEQLRLNASSQRQEAQSQYEQAMVHYVSGKWTLAAGLARKLATKMDSLQNIERWEVYQLQMHLALRTGELQNSVEVARQMSALAVQMGSVELGRISRTHLAHALLNGGRLPDAERILGSLLESRSRKSFDWEDYRLSFLAACHAAGQGKLHQAEQHFSEAQAVVEALQIKPLSLKCQYHKALCAVDLGRFEQARLRFTELLASFENTGRVSLYAGLCACQLGFLQLAEGDLQGAIAHLARAEVVAQKVHHLGLHCQVLGLKALCLQAADKLDEALITFSEMYELAGRALPRATHARWLLMMADAHSDAQRFQEAGALRAMAEQLLVGAGRQRDLYLVSFSDYRASLLQLHQTSEGERAERRLLCRRMGKLFEQLKESDLEISLQAHTSLYILKEGQAVPREAPQMMKLFRLLNRVPSAIDN